MLLPSTGLTCATFCSKDGMLTSGTGSTVPEISAGSSCPISFSSRDDRRVLRAVGAGHDRQDRARPRAVHDGDRDVESPASTPAGTSIDAGRLLPARRGGRADGKRALVGAGRSGDDENEGDQGNVSHRTSAQISPTARDASTATTRSEITDCSIVRTFAQRDRTGVSVGENAVELLNAMKR